MNNKKDIEARIEEAMESLDHVERASPMPFLLTRIRAKIGKRNVTVWERVSWLIGRPSVAIPGLLVLIILNVLAITINKEDNPATSTEQLAPTPADEFSFTVATIYDIENTEP